MSVSAGAQFMKSQNTVQVLKNKNLGYSLWLLAKCHHSGSLKASRLGASTAETGRLFLSQIVLGMTFDGNLYERRFFSLSMPELSLLA